jgi:transposase, IS5 family
MHRNHLNGRESDRITAVLAAAGYYFSLPLRWFRRLLCALLLTILARAALAPRFA